VAPEIQVEPVKKKVSFFGLPDPMCLGRRREKHA
jgi:hypothetical protein